jgi:hypothetical protein
MAYFKRRKTTDLVESDGTSATDGSGDWVATMISGSSVANAKATDLATITGSLGLGGQKLTSVGSGSADTDAVNKGQMDLAIEASALGLDFKESCDVATAEELAGAGGEASGAWTYNNSNKTLTSPANGVTTLDGVALAADDRVLVKNQGTALQNGIYEVTTAGAVGATTLLTRAEDADTDADMTANIFVFIEEGSTQADSSWVLTTNDAITLGSTSLVFTQFGAGSGLTAGTGAGQVIVNAAGIADNDFLRIDGSTIEGLDDSQMRTALGLVIGTHVQAYDAQLDSLAGWTANQVTTLGNIGTITTAANQFVTTSGADTFIASTVTAAGLALLDDANVSAQRTTMGVAIGSDVQAYDADLAALAGLTSAADKGIQFTGSGAAATYDLTTAGKALLDDANASTQRTTMGVAIGSDVQAFNATLGMVAGLTMHDSTDTIVTYSPSSNTGTHEGAKLLLSTNGGLALAAGETSGSTNTLAHALADLDDVAYQNSAGDTHGWTQCALQTVDDGSGNLSLEWHDITRAHGARYYTVNAITATAYDLDDDQGSDGPDYYLVADPVGASMAIGLLSDWSGFPGYSADDVGRQVTIKHLATGGSNTVTVHAGGADGATDGEYLDGTENGSFAIEPGDSLTFVLYKFASGDAYWAIV